MTRLIAITLDCCRIRTNLRLTDGARVPCVCGRKTVDCNRHASQRTQGKPWFEIGYYVACALIENHVHGKCGTYMSPEEYRERKDKETDAMNKDIEAQRDGDLVTEEEEVEQLPNQNQGVTFARNSPSDSEYHDARGTILNFEHKRTNPPDGRNPTRGQWWYGLYDIVGDRRITADTEELKIMKESGFTIKKVFRTRADAEKWEKEKTRNTQSPEDDDSDEVLEVYSDYDNTDASKDQGTSAKKKGTKLKPPTSGKKPNQGLFPRKTRRLLRRRKPKTAGRNLKRNGRHEARREESRPLQMTAVIPAMIPPVGPHMIPHLPLAQAFPLAALRL